MKATRARRIIQITVFIGMFIIPLLNLLEIYFIKGTFISMDIGSLGIADPVMIFQALLSGMSAAGVLLVSVVIPLLLVLFFGRVWCSWACPYTLILQLAERLPFLRKRILSNKAKATANNFRVRLLRYAVFIGFFVLVGIAGVPILHLFSPPAVISTQALLLVKTAALSVELLFIVVILVIDLRFSYRFTCRVLCPTGTCLSLFKTSKSLQVQYAGECSNCGACVKACPMKLDPKQESGDRLCYNCGECIEACQDASKPLKWGFGEK
ncbi:MAG: 4Fe-4S binding protein [Deferribacteraceae bacterium]|jgi:ferredoxin-type protein NapH|nr:4Fe-4S binding protein [Deferribacteraceae bacterium]